MPLLEEALASLRRGEFILLHDSDGREDEVDMVAYAGTLSPEHVARMRQSAGGLLCAAVDYEFASAVGIRYMHDILAHSDAMRNKSMIMGLAPYGDRSTFSISVNSIQTYTGITDRDRSTTISTLADICDDTLDIAGAFARSFRTPGHVPLLIASRLLLEERQGHTEMSIYLAKMAGLRPVMAVCEMMDAETYAALSVEKASEYATQHGIPLVDGKDLAKYARVHQH